MMKVEIIFYVYWIVNNCFLATVPEYLAVLLSGWTWAGSGPGLWIFRCGNNTRSRIIF
jgi:hypothetical protein